MDYYLPDTDMAAVARNDRVFLYAQALGGELVENRGECTTGNYQYRSRSDVVPRYAGNNPIPGAPKLFTPLAAAFLGNARVGHP
jgi:hypothetical protein